VDGVAERPQAIDVVADRSRADLEAVGELRARPVARGLEQREQAEEPTDVVTIATKIPRY
jgi:hypothetical protein